MKPYPETLEPAIWARNLGISRDAIDLYASCDVIDLHVDTFIWTRIAGYDPLVRHGRGLLGARFYSQVDLPRLREAHVTGALWSITTNPLRHADERAAIFVENLAKLRAIFAKAQGAVELVRDATGYRRAVASGKHAAFVCIQGGNALDRDPEGFALLTDEIVLVTLVHLSTSALGVTSAPHLGSEEGLTGRGKAFVEALDEKRIFVDLAHVSRKGFWDAVDVHRPDRPLCASHTGVCGVHDHWRNLDDDQLRAIAKSGGVVGIIYQSSFLGNPWMGGKAARIVDHLEHVIRVVGEDVPALGSDWDGMILPPRDMPTCLELPRLVQIMQGRGWSAERIAKILGGNFLRALETLRG